MINKTNRQLAILQDHLNKSFEVSKSKAGSWLQYTIVQAKEGEVAIRLEVREDMTNPQKRLHGGVIALIMDEVLGLANYSMGNDTFYTTSGLHINYLYGADMFDVVTAYAKVIRCGQKVAYIEGNIVNSKNIEIARANTTLINTGTRIFDIHVE